MNQRSLRRWSRPRTRLEQSSHISFFFFQAEDGIRDYKVTGVQTCALPIYLVNVIASVADKKGRPVPDLPKEEFEIYEEGVRQKIEVFEAETRQPLDLALMINSSLSTGKELAFEREAAARFIRQVVRPGD